MAKSFEDSLTDAQIELLAKAQQNPDALEVAELEEMARLQKRYEVFQGPETTGWDVAKGAGSVVIRALDLPGGLVRVAGGQLAELATGKDDIVTKEDYLNALMGNAPTTATMLERGGVGEMGSVDLPVLGKVTGRGVIGGIGDIASGLGASSALKAGVKAGGLLGKAANIMRAPEAIVEKGVQTAGKKLYQSGAKALDIVGERFGKGSKGVSDTMLKYGIAGSPESVKNQIKEVIDRLSRQQQDILQTAASKGAVVDFEQVLKPVSKQAGAIQKGINIAPVKAQAGSAQAMLDELIEQGKYVPEKVIKPEAVQAPLLSSVDEAISVPTKQMGAIADVPLKGRAIGQQTPLFPLEQLSEAIPESTIVEETVNRGVLPKAQQPLLTPMEGIPAPKATVIPGQAPASILDASKIKTQIYNQLGDVGYSALAKDKAGAKLFKRAANRLKIAVEQSADRVDPGLGATLRETNKDLGNFLTVLKKVDQEAAKDIMKNSITQIDSTLAVMALADPSAALPAAVGKGIGKLLTSGGFRTRVGKAMATSPAAGMLTSQAAIAGSGGRGVQDDNIAKVLERIKYGR